jgi:hypothetical protein
MDFFQFAAGLIMIGIGLVIIFFPELATIIAVILFLMGLVVVYDAVHISDS